MSVPLRAGTVTGPANARSTYREFAASVPVVACTWEGDPGWRRTMRVLPDGCVDLVWEAGEIRVAFPHLGPARHELRSRTTGVRLRPGTAGAVLGVPVSELAAEDESVPLERVWGRRARRLEAELAGAGTRARQVLEREVAETRIDRAVVEAAHLLGASGAEVTTVAGEVGLSGRELRRRFHEQVGMGPKSLHRVLRFQRFVREIGRIALGDKALRTVAADAGYADQAHLTRECRRLSGSSPRVLVARWAAEGAAPGRNVQDSAEPGAPESRS